MIRCKKVSPSLWNRSSSFLETSRQFCICSDMSTLGTQRQLTLENLSNSRIMWWAVPVDMSSCWAISSTVILLSARIKSFTACCFSGVFISDGLPCLGSSLILLRPALNLHISLVQTATPKLGRHSSIDFTWFYIFSSKKSDHCSLFFMCRILQGSSNLKKLT